MSILDVSLLMLSCLFQVGSTEACLEQSLVANAPATPLAEIMTSQPRLTGDAVDVVLTAKAAYAWDVATRISLYEKEATTRRPIASITKLLATLTAVDQLDPDQLAIVSPTAAKMSSLGASIKLPAGHEATVEQLVAASLIASANDAMVVLAEAVSGDEEMFVGEMNSYARQHNLLDTLASNATGLPGGEQFSTARDVSHLMTLAYNHPRLHPLLNAIDGTLRTEQGAVRHYESTNKLLKTYVPVQAAKTGYTAEAGENLVIITEGAKGQQIGAVILGSEQRFQDMKVLLEWVQRNYSW